MVHTSTNIFRIYFGNLLRKVNPKKLIIILLSLISTLSYKSNQTFKTHTERNLHQTSSNIVQLQQTFQQHSLALHSLLFNRTTIHMWTSKQRLIRHRHSKYNNNYCNFWTLSTPNSAVLRIFNVRQIVSKYYYFFLVHATETRRDLAIPHPESWFCILLVVVVAT